MRCINMFRWSSFANSELLPPIMAWINPVIGKAPSSPEILAAAEKYSEGMVSVVEKSLAGRKYLVGDVLTMADLFVIAAIARGYQFVSQILHFLEQLNGMWMLRSFAYNFSIGVCQEVGGCSSKYPRVLYEDQGGRDMESC